MEIEYTLDFLRNYTLSFYTRKQFFDGQEPQRITEQFTNFAACVLRARELMLGKQRRLVGLGLPDFNCLISWEDSDQKQNSLRCDFSLWGFNFKSCLAGKEEEEHIWKLNDIWEGRY